jgi:tetratricopeptide (TPR) repeat protein
VRSNGRLVWAFLLAGPVAAQTTHPAPRAPDRETLLNQAAADLAAGRRADAAARLREATDRFRSVRAMLQLADLQARSGDRLGSLDLLARARAAAPNSGAVLVAYAEASLAAGAPSPAVLALEPLTRMWPAVAQYHVMLGNALMRVGDLETAVAVLRRAERLEPGKASTLIALGVALIGRELYAEATPYLLRGLDLEPDAALAMSALSEAESGLGDLKAAEGHARRALARSNTDAGANLALGIALLKGERYAEARDALERATAGEPGSSKAHAALARVYAGLNDDTRAQQHVALAREDAAAVESRVKLLRGQMKARTGAVP